ncbi:MAG: methyltransferase domain-containing protein [Alphaproteobacteria bacterium]|nr:methyltransferase domain-containing protein [Alphaproteobacteria bacterium]
MEYCICFICFVAIIFNLYWIISYACSHLGKYPPFIISMGESKEVVVKVASDYLAKSDHQLNIVDLGCGCGSLLLPLAKKFPKHQFIGIERDIVAYIMMKLRSYKYDNIRVIYGNFMECNWAKYDVFLCYVGNEIAPYISQKVKKEAKERAILISETFMIPELYLINEISVKTYGLALKIFIYNIFDTK